MLDGIELDAELLDLRRPLAVSLLDLRDVLPLALRARHFVAGGILVAFQPFDLGENPSAAGLERRQFFELSFEVEAAPCKAGADRVEVVAEQSRIEHSTDDSI
jgi:hypothetical protein